MSGMSPAGADHDAIWSRLEDQLDWYDRKSGHNQKLFIRVKMVQLILGGAVPVLSLASLSALATAITGAIVVILEGAQQLFQWQANWIAYRSTAEALKHERHLYLAQAGPYVGRDRPRVLAERIEGLVSQEHAKWTHSHEGHGKSCEEMSD
jgi:Protein of unknown function (DUF4231)